MRKGPSSNACALMARTRKHNGEFVMLWHNTFFEPAPGNYHPSLYGRLLKEIG